MQGVSEPLAPPTDLAVQNRGSIRLFWPLTPAAREWMAHHCPAGPDHHYCGAALVVEPRYVSDLIAYAIEDGLSA